MIKAMQTMRRTAAILVALTFPLAASASPTLFVVTNASDSGPGSLRDALTQAQNCLFAPATIAFNIPGTGPHVISAGSSLPTITCSGTTIDAYTQPGATANTASVGTNTAQIKIQLDGGGAGCRRAFGTLNASDVTIRGLSITNFTCDTAYFNTGSNIVFEGNYVNVTPAGSSTGGTGLYVNTIGSGSIGGAGAAQHNLFAGSGTAIYLNTSQVTVQNNQFNVCPCGSLFSTNRVSTGVYMNTNVATVVGNVFRGTSSDAIYNGGNNNIIDDNKFEQVSRAVYLNGFANQVTNNSILNAGSDGLYVSGCCHLIQGNTIQNSGGNGIGLGFSGNADIVENLIEGSGLWGVGGATGGWISTNTIRNNDSGGVQVVAGDLEITGNSIYGNGGPGIDNGSDGANPNDEAAPPYDTDTGPNDLQNHPVITSVVHSGGNTIVSGYLKTDPPPVFGPLAKAAGFIASGAIIELFSNGAIPPFNEGQNHIGSLTPAFDASGFSSWSLTVPGTHNYISATVIVDTCGDGCVVTSEYSPAVAAAARLAAINVSPTSVAFGDVFLGTSRTAEIVVRSTGEAPLIINAIFTSAPFTQSHDCPPRLEPGATCTIVVGFQATIAGSHSGQLRITSTASEIPFTVALSANVPAIPPANLEAASAIDFGQVILGEAARQPLVLQNGGGQALVISEVLVSGAGFALEGTCVSIAPGESCTLTLVFTSSAPGGFLGRVEIASNSAAGRHVVDLVAEGVRAPTPRLELSVSSLAFGTQGVGSASASQAVRLTSVGGVAVELGAMRVTPEFLVNAGTCGATLAPGASCEITISFQPLAPGSRNGRLVILSNATNPPQIVRLSGRGCRLFSVGSRRDPSSLCAP